MAELVVDGDDLVLRLSPSARWCGSRSSTTRTWRPGSRRPGIDRIVGHAAEKDQTSGGWLPPLSLLTKQDGKWLPYR